MDINKIVLQEINKYIENKCMLKEYKNPKDSETVRVCKDMLQQLYNSVIEGGMSKREITVEMLYKIIGEISRLEQMMSM